MIFVADGQLLRLGRQMNVYPRHPRPEITCDPFKAIWVIVHNAYCHVAPAAGNSANAARTAALRFRTAAVIMFEDGRLERDGLLAQIAFAVLLGPEPGDRLQAAQGLRIVAPLLRVRTVILIVLRAAALAVLLPVLAIVLALAFDVRLVVAAIGLLFALWVRCLPGSRASLVLVLVPFVLSVTLRSTYLRIRAVAHIQGYREVPTAFAPLVNAMPPPDDLLKEGASLRKVLAREAS